MFDKSQLPKLLTEGPLSLPPLPNTAVDFNHLMQKFHANTFCSEECNRAILLFDATQPVDNGFGRTGVSHYTLTQPFFLVRGSQAVQLFMNPGAYSESTDQYFEVLGEGPVSGSYIKIIRDFNRVTVETSLVSGYSHTQEYVEQEIDTATLTYTPYPAYPKLFLHHESIGYVCFAFNRFGCHPFLAARGLPKIEIRCFHGAMERWTEADVLAVTLGQRGTGNLRLQTSLGEFFIPGENSVGVCSFQPPRGSSMECTEFNLEELKNPLSRSFDLEAHKALRSLGFPPIWPDPDFL